MRERERGETCIWLKLLCSTSVRCRLNEQNLRDKDSRVRRDRAVESLSNLHPNTVRTERKEGKQGGG